MIKHCYIHVPFCTSICAYCDFTHQVYNADKVEKWLNVIQKDIESKDLKHLDTLYIGGGTPTSLSENQLDRLLSLFDIYISEIKEYTIEVNPETMTDEKLMLLKRHGINRISMGLEASQACLLKIMHRKHKLEDVQYWVKQFKENGIDNISLDALYSLKDQTLDMFKETLIDIIQMNVKHVSIYGLTIEENTIFGKTGYMNQDEDVEADMYEMACQILNENGYKQYEISNFSKEGYESQHNIGYWNYDDFYGIGCGSSGKEDHKRYDNTRNINHYIDGKNDINEIILSKEDEMFEQIMMSLRMINGLDINLFNQKYETDFLEVYKEAINRLKNKQFITIEDGFIKCKNIALCNEILIEFME